MTLVGDPVALAREAHSLEEPLQQLRGTAPALERGGAIDIRPGRRPVLLVAAHAVPHWRGSDWKSREPFTAACAWQAGALGGASVLVVRQVLPEDANFDPGGLVKQELAEAIARLRPRLVLDLHGADQTRGFEVALGTRRGESLRGRPELLDAVVRGLRDAGLAVSVADEGMFSAASERTICAYVSDRLATPALQIEINRLLRRPRRAPQKYAALVEGLVRAVIEAGDPRLTAAA